MDRKRYTYAMGLLIGSSVQFISKTENSISVAMGLLVELRVRTAYLKDRKRYTYAMGLFVELGVQLVRKTENGIRTPWDCRVRRTTCHKDRKRCTYIGHGIARRVYRDAQPL